MDLKHYINKMYIAMYISTNGEFHFYWQVKWVRLLYSDFSVFTKDQERLISMKGNKNSALDYLEGMVLMNQGPINNWRSSFFPLADHHRILSLVTQHTVLYCLEFAKYYDDHSENNVNKVNSIFICSIVTITYYLRL
jgi:cytokinin dehydrogenase